MKRLYNILIFAFVFLQGTTFAQCVINNGNTTPGITASNPDDTITQGLAYSQTLQVYAPSSYEGVTIDSVHIVSITGAPVGITYIINPASGTIQGGGNGAICYTGTTNASVGSYALTFNGNAYGKFLGNPETFPLSGIPSFAYTFYVKAQAQSPCAGLMLSTTVLRNNNICSYDSTGRAVASVAGNVSNITYLWNSNPPQSDSVLDDVPAGTYTVSVSSGDSLCATDSVIITSLSVLTVTASVDTNCSSPEYGNVSTNASGGTPAYTYYWSAGGGFGPLPPGTYYVTVTDANGCTATDSVTVDSLVHLVINDFTEPASCPAYNNGIITAEVAGGVPNYLYVWNTSPPQNSQTAYNLMPGLYTVTVTDAHDCTASASFTVGQTAPADSLVVTNAKECNGHIFNGSITANAFGGTPLYTYSWSDGQNGEEAINLAPATYYVTITDNAGCSVFDSATVLLIPAVSLSITTGNTGCGSATGYAIAIASGGSSSFTYLWNTTATTDTIMNLAAGFYSVTVANSGCSVSASDTLQANQPQSVVFNNTSFNFCPGDSEQICVTNTNDFTAYNWNVGGATACIFAKADGSYYLTVTDQNACTAESAHISVTLFPAPTAEVGAHGDTLMAYGAGIVAYQWLINGDTILNATNSIYIAQQIGSYSLGVTDSNGCQAILTPVCGTCTGIASLTNNTWVKVYPNPSTNGPWQLQVSGDILGSAVAIFDADGRQVYQSQIKSLNSQLDLDLAKGIYLMRITSQDRSFNLKLTRL